MITVIKSPFVQYKLTILRNKKTSNTVFRQTMNEISYLIASDVLQYVPFKKQTIETPLKKMSGTALGQPIILVPILRVPLKKCNCVTTDDASDSINLHIHNEFIMSRHVSCFIMDYYLINNAHCKTMCIL